MAGKARAATCAIRGKILCVKTLVVFFLLLLAMGAGAELRIVRVAEDGAWTWYNDLRALVHNGALYVGYVRNADGRTALSAVTPDGVATTLFASSWVEKDDHNNPGLLPLDDGRLLALYAKHGSDRRFLYRISTTTNPISSADWGDEKSFTTPAGVTYMNPFQLRDEDGKIYLFTRNLNFNPTVLTSTDRGETWSAPQHFIRTGAGRTRPYVKYCSDGAGRIDFLYTDGHPRNVNNSLYHCFYTSNALWKSDCSLLKSWSALPLEHDAGERGSVIYRYSDAPAKTPDDHIPTGRAWCADLVRNSNGWPVAVFTVQRDNVTGTGWESDRIFYYYAWWTPADGWQKRFIAHAGRPLYEAEDDYSGGITLDPENPSTLYVSSNALHPFDLSSTTNVPLNASARCEIYRGQNSGSGRFTWTPVTQNSTTDNLRPFVPRNRGIIDCLVWFRGTYSTYTRYQTEVVARFDNTTAR